MDTFETRRRVWFPPRLIVGLGFITAGVLLVLDRFTTVDIGRPWQYWPLFLIAIGLSKIVQPGMGRGGGLLLVGLGTWFLGNNLGWWWLRFNDLFPFLIILVGVMVIGRAFFGFRPGRLGLGWDVDRSSRFDAFSMMGLVRRATDSPSFRGGNATAIMGACEIDLRQATLAEEGAVLDCFALWGGIQIAVPEGWSVVNEGTPIMGAFDDRRSVQPVATSRQQLVIRGLALMGGIEIRHRFERDPS